MMNFHYIIFSTLLAVTVADSRSRNTHFQPIEDFPHLQEKYPDIKYVASFGSSRIVGGEVAKPGQFPYQVRQLAFTTDTIFPCGASVISSEYVLTAAHCVDNEDIIGMQLFFGFHNVSGPEEFKVNLYGTINVIVHPNWDNVTMQNDIALLKLDEPIPFTPRVQPVALPTRSQASFSFEGDMAIVSGWGAFTSGGGQSDVLRFVQLPIISNAQCRKRFSNVTASNICADGANGHSTCGSDSGGPLVVNKKGKTIQIGIVSFAGTPCDAGYPAGFARVTSYLDFIENNSNIVIAP